MRKAFVARPAVSQGSLCRLRMLQILADRLKAEPVGDELIGSAILRVIVQKVAWRTDGILGFSVDENRFFSRHGSSGELPGG